MDLRHPCPSCFILLDRAGVGTVNGREFAVYQCENCKRKKWMFGELFYVALTFGVLDDGTIVDGDGRSIEPAQSSE